MTKKQTKFKHLILAQLIYSLDKNKVGQLLLHESTNYSPTISCILKMLILTKGKIFKVKKKKKREREREREGGGRALIQIKFNRGSRLVVVGPTPTTGPIILTLAPPTHPIGTLSGCRGSSLKESCLQQHNTPNSVTPIKSKSRNTKKYKIKVFYLFIFLFPLFFIEL